MFIFKQKEKKKLEIILPNLKRVWGERTTTNNGACDTAPHVPPPPHLNPFQKQNKKKPIINNNNNKQTNKKKKEERNLLGELTWSKCACVESELAAQARGTVRQQPHLPATVLGHVEVKIKGVHINWWSWSSTPATVVSMCIQRRWAGWWVSDFAYVLKKSVWFSDAKDDLWWLHNTGGKVGGVESPSNSCYCVCFESRTL